MGAKFFLLVFLVFLLGFSSALAVQPAKSLGEKQVFEFFVPSSFNTNISYSELGSLIEKDLKLNSENYVLFESNQRFNVFVDQTYLANNSDNLTDFFNKFSERFNLLESTTKWNSEKFYSKKLDIYVSGVEGCYGGYGGQGNVFLQFSDPLYVSGCLSPDGTGELNSTWPYMAVAIHEATHAINPPEIQYRNWLREGWGKYYEYNILSASGDITHATADRRIYLGSSFFNWDGNAFNGFGYITNDYHDTCVSSPLCPAYSEIQESYGYEITAWMLSMLKNDFSLDWDSFYLMLNNNPETMKKSSELDSLHGYKLDSFILFLLAKNSDADLSVFEYNGSNGPGWGVRHIFEINWLADLSPEISFSKANPFMHDNMTLNLTVYNTGLTDSNNVIVRLYDGTSLVQENTVDVPANSSVDLTYDFIGETSNYFFRAVVDEDNLKLESDESNNEATQEINFAFIQCGNIDGVSSSYFDPNISDLTYLVSFLFNGGPEPVSLWAANVDGSSGPNNLNIADVTYLTNFLFKGGPAPVCS